MKVFSTYKLNLSLVCIQVMYAKRTLTQCALSKKKLLKLLVHTANKLNLICSKDMLGHHRNMRIQGAKASLSVN